MSMPTYGQYRSNPNAAPDCTRHPGVRSVDYCKRCNRPMCIECIVPTEVRNVCVDCASSTQRGFRRSGPLRGRGRTVAGMNLGDSPVTYGIIIACVALFIVGFVSDSAYRAMLFTPGLGLTQPWRFLSTAFLHSGTFHIMFNMLALFSVGRSIEQVLGHWRFGVLYALSAVGGSAAVLAWGLIQPESLSYGTVGASGAVFGLFASIFILQKLVGADTRTILVLLGINLVYGFIGSNISWQAHVGGMITGAVVTWVLVKVGRPRAGVTAKKQGRQSVLAAVAMSVGMVAAIALIYRVIFEVLY
ncbi:rhomboid family intramembrane serine protease [Schaalia vaccimaxillae]|uniref:rhomboid family intramembrane serine protease n=1 Tax=Schaalia vaccimaxillae TaxID=183916 RepID=UPI00047DF2A5|nr:rhomboid family intramembrane serine protease [Schaalia vaccimaxillae]